MKGCNRMATPKRVVGQGAALANTKPRVYGLDQMSPVEKDTNDRRAQLPKSQREALRFALNDLVIRFGSENNAAKHVGISQQVVNKGRLTGRIGAEAAFVITSFLRTTIHELVEKYGTDKLDEPAKENVMRMTTSDEVKAVAEGKEWLPETISHLEMHFRATQADGDELAFVGDSYDKINRLAGKQREVNRERAQVTSEIFTKKK